MSLSSPLTVIGMVNGMIGGFILILPVNALNAGYVFSLLVILIIGAFSYYSCYLCVVHLGNQKDLDHVMYNHFNKSIVIKIIYDLTVFCNLLFIGFLYFDLICIQWNGILNSQSIAIPLANTAALLILIFLLKYFQFGATVMAYGIISIIGYVIFLIWVLATAPSGNRQWEPIGTGEINLAAAMGGAYSIQTFFIPVLRRNPRQEKYVFFTLLANVIGGSVYMYIAFMGSFGILNRTSVISTPQDIQNFFPAGKFQLMIIQILYLIHLYSVFPQFALISKKRLFSIFCLKQTQKGKIPIPQIIYAIIFVGICLLINLLDVKINTIVDINGSVIGFFFIYFLPAILHIRCQYFSKNKITIEEKMKLIDKENQIAIINETTDRRTQETNNMNMVKNINQVVQNKRNTIFQLKSIQNNKSAKQQIKSIQSKHRQSSIYHTVRTLSTPDENQNNPNLKTIPPSQFTPINLNKTLSNRQQLIIQQPVYNPILNQHYYVCDCKKPKKLILQILQLIILTIMILLGAFILVNGIMSVAS